MKKMCDLFLSLWMIVFGASCQKEEPHLDPNAKRTEIARDIFATQTVLHPTSTFTPTATPTHTSSPMASPTPTFTATPSYPVVAHTPVPDTSQAIAVNNVEEVVGLATWGKGEAYQATYSPDGTLLAVASNLGVYLYHGQDLSFKQFLPMKPSALGITFSPDGTILAAGSEGERLFLWNVMDGALLRQFTIDFEYENPIYSVVFSPDGDRIAASGYGAVALLDPENGSPLAWLETRSVPNTSLSFSHDGKRIAVGTDTGDISIWDLEEEVIIQSMGHADQVTKLAFSLDDHFLASCGGDARVWQVETGKLEHQIESYGCSLSFSPISNILAVGTSIFGPPQEAKVEFFQAGGWEPSQTWEIGQGTFLELSNSPDENAFFTMVDVYRAGHTYQVLQVWTEEGLQGWTSHNQTVVSLDFSQDRQFLLPGFRDGTIWLLQNKNGNLLRGLDPIDETPDDLLHPLTQYGLVRAFFSPDDRMIYSVFQNGTLGSANVHGDLTYTTVEWDEPPDGEALSPDGQIVAAGESAILGTSDISLWHSTGGESYQTLKEGVSASLLTFSPDGTYLATNQGKLHPFLASQEILVFRLEDGSLLHEFKWQDTPSVLLFSPDSSRLAVGTMDLWVHIRDLETGELLYTLDAQQLNQRSNVPSPPPTYSQELGVTCLSFSPDGRLLVVGTKYGNVQFWDLGDGSLILQNPYPFSLLADELYSPSIWNSAVTVTSMAFSSDSSLLAVGGSDGRIELWGIPGD